ncbi:hypothetical protein BN130_3525 [Cronobacter malonaticus 507]|nr:hypothetical protein BN130_3525 [Cronobacter malonaticus 507]
MFRNGWRYLHDGAGTPRNTSARFFYRLYLNFIFNINVMNPSHTFLDVSV